MSFHDRIRVFPVLHYLRNISYNLGKVTGIVKLSDFQIVVHPKANQNLTPNQTLSLLNFIIFIYSYSTIWHTVIVYLFIWDNLTLFRNILTKHFCFTSSPTWCSEMMSKRLVILFISILKCSSKKRNSLRNRVVSLDPWNRLWNCPGHNFVFPPYPCS